MGRKYTDMDIISNIISTDIEDIVVSNEENSVIVRLAYLIRHFRRSTTQENFKKIYTQLRKQVMKSHINQETYFILVNKLCVCFCNFNDDEIDKMFDKDSKVMELKKEAQSKIDTILKELSDETTKDKVRSTDSVPTKYLKLE